MAKDQQTNTQFPASNNPPPQTPVVLDVAVVEDGKNPNAPDQPDSLEQLLAAKQEQLDAIRAKVAGAKKAHERNLEEARRLRALLAKSEGSVIDNPFEVLSQQEAQIMGEMQRLTSKMGSRTIQGVR